MPIPPPRTSSIRKSSAVVNEISSSNTVSISNEVKCAPQNLIQQVQNNRNKTSILNVQPVTNSPEEQLIDSNNSMQINANNKIAEVQRIEEKHLGASNFQSSNPKNVNFWDVIVKLDQRSGLKLH